MRSAKTGLFSTVLETLLDASDAMPAAESAQLLLAELESARGDAYNRWLGGSHAALVRVSNAKQPPTTAAR